MDTLHLGIEIRDFDLERMGFSLSVLDQTGMQSTSEAYLRMTLEELNVFLNALKAAQGQLALSATESTAGKKLPSAPAMPKATEPVHSAGDAPLGRRR